MLESTSSVACAEEAGSMLSSHSRFSRLKRSRRCAASFVFLGGISRSLFVICHQGAQTAR